MSQAELPFEHRLTTLRLLTTLLLLALAMASGCGAEEVEVDENGNGEQTCEGEEEPPRTREHAPPRLLEPLYRGS